MTALLQRLPQYRLFVAIFCVYALGWVVQSRLLLNHDVAWLFDLSLRLLKGGHYVTDFFENNPPLILYLYMPPAMIVNCFALNAIFCLRIYVFLLASLSLYGSYIFARDIFSDDDHVVRDVFLIALAAIFLLLPLYDFAQREHLLLIFMMPYLLMMVLRLMGRPMPHAAWSGLFAVCGFALKPYFLVIPVLVECYYVLRSKNFFAWWRVEVLVMLSMMLLYATTIFILHPDYFFIIVPFALRWCYASAGVPWLLLLLQMRFVFCMLVMLLYVILLFRHAYQPIVTVLMLACIGCLFSFLLQQTIFPYHILPAFSLSILLVLLLLCDVIRRPLPGCVGGLLLLLATLMLLFLYSNASFIRIIFLFQSAIFWLCLLGIGMFFFFLQRDRQNGFVILSVMLFMMLSSHFFSKLVSGTPWYEYRFSFTLLFFVVLFTLFLGKHKIEKLILFVITTLFLSFPLYVWYVGYTRAVEYKKMLQPIIQFVEQHAAHKSVYFFSTVMEESSIAQTTATHAGRFSGFWMLAGLVKQNNPHVAQSQAIKDRDFLIEMIVNDLNKEKPALVFVDVSDEKNQLNWIKTVGLKPVITQIPFNYLKYFSQNPHFKAAWRHYQYVTMLEGRRTLATQSFYRYDVYRRR